MRLTVLLAGILCLGACGDGDTRACFGSIGFCEDAFGRNEPPEASAGHDQEVLSGDEVDLDGSGSFDPDGRIASYSWTQRSGKAVILVGGAEAVASFAAPEVDDTTVLEFRLVVTDDDDASDADNVRVTVVPGSAAALALGEELLKSVHTPSVAFDSECAACWSFLGLWLSARVEAAVSTRDGSLDAFLDEVRVIEQLLAGQAPAAGVPASHRRLLELGQHRVARFTERRDPAVAEMAGRCLANPLDVPPIRMRDLTDAYPHLAALIEGHSPRLDAARLLLGRDPERLAPEVIATATLLLALPELPPP